MCFAFVVIVGKHLKKGRLSPPPWSKEHVLILRFLIELLDVLCFVGGEDIGRHDEMMEI
jgi:hypothetical protein